MAKFSILAERNAEDRQTFTYDNAANTLTTQSGFVFGAETDTVHRHYQPFGNGIPLKKSARVKILKIQLGLSCNYACTYCSQRFVPHADETSAKHVDAFMKKLDALQFSEADGLKIELWGGEPLVYWKTIAPLVAALKKRFASWENKPRYSMITNGSLLTDEIADWLYDNQFSVAISHDGPGQHVRGPDPFDDPEQKAVILRFWRRMHAARRISFNAMLNGSNTSRKAIYDWFVALTDDPSVQLGEGSVIDAYDADGKASSIHGDVDHFAFRRQAFNDIYSTGGEVGFTGVLEKVDGFMRSVQDRVPRSTLQQKCGMDLPDVIAVDLRGNVVTCQNVSAAATAPNGRQHIGGNIANVDAVALHSSTHWSNRPNCRDCPVLHLCQGSCMYLKGDLWDTSCENSYSDNIVLFALAFERITGGYVPIRIDNSDGVLNALPENRRDIWGSGDAV